MKDLVQEIGHEGERILRGFDMIREDDSEEETMLMPPSPMFTLW